MIKSIFSSILGLLLLFAFCYSLQADAKPRLPSEQEPFFAYHFNEHIRIVISDLPCDSGPGKKTSAQRIDKLYIPGCWIVDPTNESNIRIDWLNGDFSVFPMELFQPPAK